MKKILIIVVMLLTPSIGFASTAPQFPAVTAKGIAIYGWKEDGTMVPVYTKNEHRLYPIASLTKLVTAKVAEELYEEDKLFTVSAAAASTHGITNGIRVGSVFTRDDLLKALLINSSNDAATALMEPVGRKTFIDKMNGVLRANKYTATSFVNPSGLDPLRRDIRPNRMTPYNLTRLLNDIYTRDPLLVDIMSKDQAEITDLATNTTAVVRQTNALVRDEAYKEKVLMSKTGLTNLAGQNLAFVAPSTAEEYKYYTVVFVGSRNRTTDSKRIIDWLDTQTQQFGG